MKHLQNTALDLKFASFIGNIGGAGEVNFGGTFHSLHQFFLICIATAEKSDIYFLNGFFATNV